MLNCSDSNESLRKLKSLLLMRKAASAWLRCIYQRHSLAGSLSGQLVRNR
jgi:hypothetical protein